MKRIEALGFFLLVTLSAIQVAAQPAGTADLPLVVEPLYAGSTGPDLPLGELEAIASASGELPPMPEWCDGTCVIDIAFFYAPEAVGQTKADKWPDSGDPGEPYGPQTVGELRADALASMVMANILFRRAGLDAELRFVGLELDPGLAGLKDEAALDHVRRERLSYARSKYGADLVYAVTADFEAACGGYARTAGMSLEYARSFAAGVVKTGCLTVDYSFATKVGITLGLRHQPGHEWNQGFAPFVPFGYGYARQGRFGVYGSLMAVGVDSVNWFSTAEPVYGRVLGDANVTDAVRALRYTIPDAARYAPTVVPEKVEDPHGYGCRPSASLPQ